MGTKLQDYVNQPERTGTLSFEKSKRGDWYLVLLPQDFVTEMVDLAKSKGLDLKPTVKPHISVIKGEIPTQNANQWGDFVGEPIKFRCNPFFRYENGLHVWVDCHSQRLCEIRRYFGCDTKISDMVEGAGNYWVNFHCTIGKLLVPQKPNLRPQIRLSPQSHLDAETGMQHL